MGEYPNWFASDAIYYFRTHLSNYAGKQDLNFLQIGAFTGDASAWLLSKILTAKGCRLVDVDTWQGSDEGLGNDYDWSDIFATYEAKTAFSSAVETFTMPSGDYLETCTESFDFIYIDGDHTSQGVAADACGAWKLLKANGILAFDDYQWGEWLSDCEQTPAPAIDRFLDEYSGQYLLLAKARQVWIKKTDC